MSLLSWINPSVLAKAYPSAGNFSVTLVTVLTGLRWEFYLNTEPKID
jgi:hypothetical protein